MEEYGLNEEMAMQIASSPNFELFERIMVSNDNLTATLVVRVLEATIPELAKEGFPIENISDEHLMKIFELLSHGKLAKEAITDVLASVSKHPEEEIRYISIPESEIEEIIGEIVRAKRDFIMERGLRSLQPLMGLAMEKLRGKVDGKRVNKMLRERILDLL
jgi:glutamyl-tRNA(Gln) amidotransferase subunit E